MPTKTLQCVNCRSDNHASWSRGCPEFKRKCDELSAKYPENSLPYFPTCETWTHATLPPKAAPYQKPVTVPSPDTSKPPRLRQTTLFATTKPSTQTSTSTSTKHTGPSQTPGLPPATSMTNNKFAALSINDDQEDDNTPNDSHPTSDASPPATPATTSAYTPLWFPPSSTSPQQSLIGFLNSSIAHV
jgi:hypothetical protein